jgi:hypothetical protein
MILDWETIPESVVVALVAILGVARLTRVIVYDDFPPAAWWRAKWTDITNDGPWAKLFTCWWCLSSWIALLCILWFIAGLYVVWIAWAWWIVWGMLALGYAATMVIVRDEPKE